MSKVLLVTYLFPPSGGVGVPRALGYTRYLPECGCEVIVLAPSNPATAYHDPELESLIPQGTRVFRAFNPELPYRWKDRIWRRLSSRKKPGQDAVPATRPKAASPSLGARAGRFIRRLVFPDIQSTWVPFAVRAGAKIIRQFGVDTVILNTPPYSQFRIGIALKQRFPEIRLITDIRDDWLSYYVAQTDGPSDYEVGWGEKEWQTARALERAAVEASSFVSIATPAWRRILCERYPDQPEQKFICTTNGYEPALFDRFHSKARDDNKMVVTYFGTLNASRVYSPETYLRAVNQLPAEIRSRVETRFVGRVTPDCRPLLAQFQGIREYGFLPKAEGLELLEESDCLLLIATNPASHAGKLFEYLATGKPIIALCPPEGQIAAVLRETRCGWPVDPFDTDAVAALLAECWRRKWQEGARTTPDWTAVRSYSWPEIARKFAEQTGIAPSRVPQPQ